MFNKKGATGETFTVEDGEEFTVSMDDWSAETTFCFELDGDKCADGCYIHTSCSVPLAIEDQIGPFKVTSGGACNTCGGPPSCECVICDKENKRDFDSLTLTYFSDGQDSLYQDEDKASCRAGTYPSPATITMFNKKGATGETFTVEDGEEFTVSMDDWSAETTFCFELDGDKCADGCYIHTSCSVPLAIEDQIGPFKVTSGGVCERCETPAPSLFPSTPPTALPSSLPSSTPSSLPSSTPSAAPCVATDKAQYCVGDAIPVSFNYEDPLTDDWIGIYPCDVPFYLHAIVWQWNCGSPGCRNTPPAKERGTLVFDELPPYNVVGPHSWPVQAGCHRAVYLRNDGPSVPPYIQVCESEIFDVVNC